MDAYEITVTFTRYHSDDDDILKATGRTPEQQLQAELQEAYDAGTLAGHFRIVPKASV